MEVENITGMTTTPYSNSTNESINSMDSMIGFKIVFTLILVLIMFGMGCAVDHKKLIENLKKPIGITVGLVCQIFLMPVLTYCLIKISSMTTIQALALMLVGCSPGGSNSNVVTYLINGDISLSVAMTSFSNILALGTLPFWLLIFSALEHMEDNFKIPYDSLGTTLLSIGIPIVLGMAFRYKFPKPSRLIPKICSGVAMVILVITVVLLLVVTKIEFKFSAETLLPTAFLSLSGMGLSYLISCIPPLNLKPGAKKAIAIEVGIQNGGLANSVLMLTFGDKILLIGEVLTIPLLYQLFQTAYIFIIVASYRIWLCRHNKRSTQPEETKMTQQTSNQTGEKDADPLCVPEKV